MAAKPGQLNALYAHARSIFRPTFPTTTTFEHFVPWHAFAGTRPHTSLSGLYYLQVADRVVSADPTSDLRLSPRAPDLPPFKRGPDPARPAGTA